MATERLTLLDVDGMTCGSCVRHVNNALSGLEGVREIQVKLRDGQVLVRHDSEKAPVDMLIDVLDEAGYEGRTASRASRTGSVS